MLWLLCTLYTLAGGHRHSQGDHKENKDEDESAKNRGDNVNQLLEFVNSCIIFAKMSSSLSQKKIKIVILVAQKGLLGLGISWGSKWHACLGYHYITEH